MMLSLVSLTVDFKNKTNICVGNERGLSGGDTITDGSAKKYLDLILPSLITTCSSLVKSNSEFHVDLIQLKTELNHIFQSLLETLHLQLLLLEYFS